MLNYAMPLYEAKYNEEEEWIEISDLEVMDELYKTYPKVTPAIKEMIVGQGGRNTLWNISSKSDGWFTRWRTSRIARSLVIACRKQFIID